MRNQQAITNIEFNAYFCPRDDCGSIIINTVNNAESSVYCAFYDLDLKDLISTIAKKSRTEKRESFWSSEGQNTGEN